MAENITARQRKPWIEPVIALVMALTTLCTAWCSYESAAWTRHVNRLMNDSNALERKAALLDVQGSQALIVHASMFMQLLAAFHAGNEKLVSFYAERFPPDVKKAYDALPPCSSSPGRRASSSNRGSAFPPGFSVSRSSPLPLSGCS